VSTLQTLQLNFYIPLLLKSWFGAGGGLSSFKSSLVLVFSGGRDSVGHTAFWASLDWMCLLFLNWCKECHCETSSFTAYAVFSFDLRQCGYVDNVVFLAGKN